MEAVLQMAYAYLKEQAKTEDRLLRQFGHDPHIEADLDSALGFVWTDVDTSDEGIATPEEMGAFFEHWNEMMDR